MKWLRILVQRLLNIVLFVGTIVGPWVLLFWVSMKLAEYIETNIIAAFIGAAASFYFLVLHSLWRDKHERYRKAFNAGVHFERIMVRLLESLSSNIDLQRQKQTAASQGIPMVHPRFELLEIGDKEAADLFNAEEANRFFSIGVRVRELNGNMSSIDELLSSSMQAFFSKNLSVEGVRDVISADSLNFKSVEERLGNLFMQVQSSLAYVRARSRKSGPGWMRTLWWSIGLFDPVPTPAKTEEELTLIRKEYDAPSQ